LNLIENDKVTQDNLKTYSKKREEYFQNRVSKIAMQKNYTLDNPYNQKIIKKLNIHNKDNHDQPTKIYSSNGTPIIQKKSVLTKIELSKKNTCENHMNEEVAGLGPKNRLQSAKPLIKRPIQSALAKKPDNLYLRTNTASNLPTSPTRLLTFEYNLTSPTNLKNNTNGPISFHSRLMSACNFSRNNNNKLEPTYPSELNLDRKSILNENTKQNFNKCIEINKEFLLKNNPNMCLLQVAEIFGSSKLIHYKNVNI
jgi:hypothetical protein